MKKKQARKPQSRPIKTVKITDKPTLEEFLGEVVRMQKKYVHDHKVTGRAGLVFTATVKGGTESPCEATDKDPIEALAKAAKAFKADNPRRKQACAFIYVHLKGCSFRNSIPCDIGKPIANKASRLAVLWMDYHC